MRYIPPSQLYRSLYERLVALMPDELDSRLTNMVYLMMGIFLSQSVQTGRLGSQIPLRVKRVSSVRRLERFLDNAAIGVRSWYGGGACELLSAASACGQVALIIDSTKVSFGYQLLMVAVAYHGRALPIAWTWVSSRRGHSTQRKQLGLLAKVRKWLPAGVRVSLVGDTEFGHTRVLEQLDHWQWDYALRQSGRNQVCPPGASDWQPLASLTPRPGGWLWLPHSVLTRASAYPVRLFLFLAHGQTTPWLLATNLDSPNAILRLYRRRMWIEEMFGDLKRHGFDLESSHLRSFRRLNRLTLAVCLRYVWLVCEGTQALIQGHVSQVDRADRRDLSLFRIGFELIQQALTWLEPFHVHWQAVFDPLLIPFFYPIPLSGS